MPSAGFLIYSGVMPLLKTFITICAGFGLAKMELFSAAASRGASQLAMNVALPALIFSNIVPAFTPSNISELGPLFLIAFTYQLIGFALGIIIRELCYVPRNFWQGILVLNGTSNWGNLPTAVVQSIMASPPFNPLVDPELGVSYVSIFIAANNIVFWICGAARSIAWDYLPGIPQGLDAERRLSWKEKPVAALCIRLVARKHGPAEPKKNPVIAYDKDPEVCKETKVAPLAAPPACKLPKQLHDSDRSSLASHHDTLADRSPAPSVRSRPSSILTTTVAPTPSSPSASSDDLSETSTIGPHKDEVHPNKFRSGALRVLRVLRAMVTPVTIALAVSLPVALLQPLKALFVNATSSGGPDWHGPDGRPPLAFVMDSADFMGQLCVLLSLILLGTSFARLHLPRPLSRLPIMAMLCVALSKMVVLPAIGIFVVQALVKAGWIAEDAKAEKFVAMFLSGTPSAINQLIVTSLYAVGGDVDTLSAFLLVQYVFMFFASAALTAISLLLL